MKQSQYVVKIENVDKLQEVIVCNERELAILVTNIDKDRYSIIEIHRSSCPISIKDLSDFLIKNPNIEFGKKKAK